ncbi:MAG: M81 family metallopeptidase [Alphaproteobacteria bacterium]|nr:M81 family metallopeptidase [Alphaproteobacteria bacterium]
MARIAIAGFAHETNTFAPAPTAYVDFTEKNAYANGMRGAQVLANPEFAMPIGGFAAAARAAGDEMVPICWYAAEPAGPVTADAFERITAEIVHGVATSGAIDAVYLDLHGAMVADGYDDGEAEILRRVRAVIGPHMPLVASLDLHANVGPDMIRHASALVAYRTYPHVDMRETGARAHGLIKWCLANGRRPAVAVRRLPFIMPPHRQSTMTEPCIGIYAELANIEAGDPRLASLSFNMGFHLADIPMNGPSVIAYATDEAAARAAVDRLGTLVESHEAAFNVGLLPPREAIQLALQQPPGKPVVLADVQDNAGGGATADTVGILEALVAMKVDDAVLAILHDPESARAAHRAGTGATITIDLGGKLVPGHKPFRGSFVVEALSDGPFKLTGPMLRGNTGNLGKVAQLRIGGVRVVVSEGRTQCLDQAYFRHAGIEPKDHRLVVVKSTNHYRADFAPMAERIVEVAAPGLSSMDPASLPFTKLPDGIRMHGKGPAFRHPR